MANNFTASPAALTFPKVPVQGPIPGLYGTPASGVVTVTNNSGSNVTITNYGFTTSTEGDGITKPAGILPNSDFTVVPTGSSFPVTINNGSSQQFTVTYAPLRGGKGFGDVRSALLMFFSGNVALTNGTNITTTDGEGGITVVTGGEVVDNQTVTIFTVGVGGGVIEEGFDWPANSPIMGMPINMNLSALDTGRHLVSSIELYSGMGAGSSATGGIRVGARSVQIIVGGVDTATSFNLTLYAVTSGGNVQVASWTGLTYGNIGGLFVGNNEGIDLQGLPLYATVSSVTNPNSVTFTISAVVTG